LLLTKTDGSNFWAKITATSAQDSSGNATCLMVFGDVTAHKLSAMTLAARARLLILAQSLSLADMLRATLDEAEILTDSTVGFYHFIDADQNALRLQAWSTHTTQHLCNAEGMAGQHYPVDQAGAWADCIRKGRPVIHNDYAAIPNRKGLPPGHSAITRELVVPVIRGEKIMAILGVGNKPTDYNPLDIQATSSLADLAWDITEAMQAQDALKNSLHEKEVLLKEVHHRVKNNLQIMSSLLHLQADHSTDANVKDALKEMQNRVLSMALIHSHLYQSNNLASVEMADYLKTLCEQLLKSLTASHSPIQLHLDLDRAQLEIDQAIPCGLLANELITNALKHAFPNDRGGHLHISLRHNPLDAKIHFSVADDGIGLPPDFSLDSLSSLGLQVSVNLARQLGGELCLLPTTQTVFEVAFPLHFH
jgi:two-component sensor histidine kinase